MTGFSEVVREGQTAGLIRDFFSKRYRVEAAQPAMVVVVLAWFKEGRDVRVEPLERKVEGKGDRGKNCWSKVLVVTRTVRRAQVGDPASVGREAPLPP